MYHKYRVNVVIPQKDTDVNIIIVQLSTKSVQQPLVIIAVDSMQTWCLCLLEPLDHFKVNKKADIIFRNSTLWVLAWVDIEVVLLPVCHLPFSVIQHACWAGNLMKYFSKISNTKEHR